MFNTCGTKIQKHRIKFQQHLETRRMGKEGSKQQNCDNCAESRERTRERKEASERASLCCSPV